MRRTFDQRLDARDVIGYGGFWGKNLTKQIVVAKVL